ncbi:MAG: signal peptidase I [Patescibacteria group bacterium]|nr:MAG: signal peptidase I [Patescibacteria group bacterium]
MSKFSIRNAIVDMVELTIIGTAVFLLVYILVGQFLEVTGNSMYPYLQDKEHIIAEKLSIKFEPIRRGDVIIFWHPGGEQILLVKRVIALPEETIKIQNGFIYINGQKLEEPYLPANTVTEGRDFLKEGLDYKVAQDFYIVMGDNRTESTDSRYWGPVAKNKIIGRALAVFYPFENIRLLEKAK